MREVTILAVVFASFVGCQDQTKGVVPVPESTTEAVTPGLSGALLMRSASWVSVVLALTVTLTV